MEVRFSPAAYLQIDEVDEWWRTNRTKAPDLFLDSLREATLLLGSSPEAGRRFAASSRPNVRRILLGKTGHFLYYIVEAEFVLVLAVCRALRLSGPAEAQPPGQSGR